MIVVRPPDNWPAAGRKLFLAGSIEMDLAEPWQDRLAEELTDTDLVLLNPRRLAWDANLRQDISEPVFKQQVEWELEGLDAADGIIMYFDPKTKSPISLLELGLHAASGKMVVCCPEGFWRRGNVQIVCDRYRVPMVEDLAGIISEVRRRWV